MKVEVASSSAALEKTNYSTRCKTPKYGHNLNNTAKIPCKKQTPRWLYINYQLDAL